MKKYAVVGNVSMMSENEGGFSVYGFDPETGKLSFLRRQYRELSVGQQFYDRRRRILYCVDERPNQPGQMGGGGGAAALSFDPETGDLTKMSYQRTFCCNPAFICTDAEAKYLLVPHHTTQGHASVLTRDENGEFSGSVVYDSCCMELMALTQDGRIDRIRDAFFVSENDENGKHVQSHLHSVYMDHSGKYFVVSDKGLCRRDVFTIDEKEGKLVLTGSVQDRPGTASRYGVFHPAKNIFYGNFEEDTAAAVYEIKEDGKITLVQEVRFPLESNGDKEARPTDIAVTPDGRTLYISARESDTISIFDIDGEGRLAHRKDIGCGGAGPRGLCITEDGRFLYSINPQSSDISCFAVSGDGELTFLGTTPVEGNPGNMVMIG